MGFFLLLAFLELMQGVEFGFLQLLYVLVHVLLGVDDVGEGDAAPDLFLSSKQLSVVFRELELASKVGRRDRGDEVEEVGFVVFLLFDFEEAFRVVIGPNEVPVQIQQRDSEVSIQVLLRPVVQVEQIVQVLAGLRKAELVVFRHDVELFFESNVFVFRPLYHVIEHLPIHVADHVLFEHELQEAQGLEGNAFLFEEVVEFGQVVVAQGNEDQGVEGFDHNGLEKLVQGVRYPLEVLPVGRLTDDLNLLVQNLFFILLVH